MASPASARSAALRRQVGVGGAVVLGLGSILGTGVFVSLGLAAEAGGPLVVLAVVIAGCLATCNGLSSAQLAAAHPVAGGTYAYGYRYLNPSMGFLAGFMFLCAKSASAATAALGFAGYTLNLVAPQFSATWASQALGLAAVVVLTALVLGGLRRSNTVNAALVALTIVALLAFVAAALPRLDTSWFSAAESASPLSVPGLLEAAALCFVAYTGYGRVATLGEEIHEPKRSIPRAVIITLIVTGLLYVAVAVAAVGAVGAARFAAAATGEAAPLEVIARDDLGLPVVAVIVSIGAIFAMLGVLLNLILGLSRVALAMGRQRDLPGVLARVDAKGQTPGPAVLLVAGIIAILVGIGSVKAAWSFSAVTVLIYYGLTNLAALRLPEPDRLYPRVVSWLGLAGCLGLAVFVDLPYLIAGAVMVGVAIAWQTLAQLLR